MDFSEFNRLLGADPGNRDPAFLSARDSGPEFRQAAEEAERFESKLYRALDLPVPADLIDSLHEIPTRADADNGRRNWLPMAMAAAVLVAIGVAGLIWQMTPHWESVEDYVVEHYRHDGSQVLAMAGGGYDADVQALLAEFDVEAVPELAGIVGVVKNCPTPDGKGVHMVLNSTHGLVTLIYMPQTPVTDRELVTFDDREAILVALERGSAIIIGAPSQRVSELYAFVQDSIQPLPGNT